MAVWPVFACVGYARSGLLGILSALLAAGVCGGGALASLLATGLFRIHGQPVAGVLLGMLIRMAVPLAACVIMFIQGGPLVEAGALVMILVYYLLMLVVETFYLVRLTAARSDNKTLT
jgi:hypothetical protein